MHGIHWENPNLVMQASRTPVAFAIIGRIIKDKSINTNPNTAKVKVFLAPSACFGSPPEVTNLNPLNIINIIATNPDRISSQKITFPRITGKQLTVATWSLPPTKHPLSFNACHINLA
ncbi:MAG: hypothetical protein KBD51_00495 [Candidatus Levybacteria bacterium]|nr:hypothetical protein [Candidatus Levybacteria bacterium]